MDNLVRPDLASVAGVVAPDRGFSRCVCVCVCVRARARVCVCVCVCLAFLRGVILFGALSICIPCLSAGFFLFHLQLHTVHGGCMDSERSRKYR
jgi:hypothetical protein